MVQLVEMSHENYLIWQERLWVSYFDELIMAGYTEAAAHENIEATKRENMPDGKLAANNFVFNVASGESNVGVVWLFQQINQWFIYDIEVYENFRGQGFGRQTMKAIEAYARANGAESISLSVFGFNETARKLYETEGYQTMRLSMKKTL